jgi:hypothetical protein
VGQDGKRLGHPSLVAVIAGNEDELVTENIGFSRQKSKKRRQKKQKRSTKKNGLALDTAYYISPG